MKYSKFVAVVLLLSTSTHIIQRAEAAAPSTGTTVSWTDDTYFDGYSSQSGVTTSDLPPTNDLVWQLYYANAPLSIPADSVNRLGLNTYIGGSNSWKFRIAISTADDTLGSFGTDSEFASGSAGYSAGGFNQSAVTTTVNIPARRYFIIGVHTGPYYRTFKTLANNRSAQINGLTYVTALNTIYYAPHLNSVVSGVPTALGGSSTAFTTYTGHVAMYSIKFKATGMPSGIALSQPAAPTINSFSSTSVNISSPSTVSNAQSYIANLYQSNGTTFIESRTVTNSQVVTGYSWSGLSPNSSYKIGFSAVGDGVTYSNSTMSSLASFTTSLGTTSVGISFSSATGTFNTPITITASITGTSTGKITFYANGKKIPNCIGKAVALSSAACAWKPIKRGTVIISASFSPSSASYLGSSITRSIPITNRTGTR